MTDPGSGTGRPRDGRSGATPDGDRAERALRAAFAEQADTVDATPLDPAALLARSTRTAGVGEGDDRRRVPARHDARIPGEAIVPEGRDPSEVVVRRWRRPGAWLAAAAVAVVALGVPLAFSTAGLRGAPSMVSGGAGAPESVAHDARAGETAGLPAQGEGVREAAACPAPDDALFPADGALADLSGAIAATACLYEIDGSGAAGLRGASTVGGDAAEALFRALTDGPIWADTVGEDLTCTPTGSVLLLRFTDAADAVRTTRLSLGDGCGFGWYDGVTARPPSRATCADVLAYLPEPVVLDPRWADVCAP